METKSEPVYYKHYTITKINAIISTMNDQYNIQYGHNRYNLVDSNKTQNN